MAVKTTQILTTLSLDDESLHENETSEKVEVKDEGVLMKRLEESIQKELILLGNFIEVEEPGFYVVDKNLNIGFAVEHPDGFLIARP